MEEKNNNQQFNSNYMAKDQGQLQNDIDPVGQGQSCGQNFQGQPHYSSFQPGTNQSFGKASMILGIVGLVVSIVGVAFLALFPLFLLLEILSLGAGIAAIVLYATGKKKTRQLVAAGVGNGTNGRLITGLVCGIITVCLALLFSISCSCTYAVFKDAYQGNGEALEEWAQDLEDDDDWKEFKKKFSEEFNEEFAKEFEKHLD